MFSKKGPKCDKLASKHVANAINSHFTYGSHASISQSSSISINVDTGTSVNDFDGHNRGHNGLFNSYWHNKYVVCGNKCPMYTVSFAVVMALFLDACIKTHCRHECANKIINKDCICVLCLMNITVAQKGSGFYHYTRNHSFLEQCANIVCGSQCFFCVPRVCTDNMLSHFPSACRLFSRQN